jgi:hypothetical protein
MVRVFTVASLPLRHRFKDRAQGAVDVGCGWNLRTTQPTASLPTPGNRSNAERRGLGEMASLYFEDSLLYSPLT